MDDKYDIYCITKFSFSEPRFTRICLVDPILRLIGDKKEVNDSGYLEINLSQVKCLWIAKVLGRFGIKAYPVPKRYKATTVSPETAMQVAKNYLKEKKIQRPDLEYSDVEEIPVSWWLTKIAFGYFSKSARMMDEGISPAGLTVYIDRESGLVLQERELINAELSLMLIE